MADNKYMNFIQCSGKVLYLRYDERSQDLSILLLTSSPRWGSAPGSNDWFHDTPMFHVYGDEAAHWNGVLKVNDRISVVGHVRGIRRNMRRQGGGLYKEMWVLDLCADKIEQTAPRLDSNSVTLAGKVTRVYRNADPGKKFYIPTISIPDPVEEGRNCLVNFTYFDRDMKWEPKVGDFVYVTGTIRTKRERENERDRRSIVLTSIVANSGTITKG